MDIIELQRLIGADADGRWGPRSKAALLAHFANRNAPAITAADIAAASARLGCSVLQLDAVRKVEANGSGFDPAGMPKTLFERHKFHRLTGGQHSPSWFSQSRWGGYSGDANRNGVDDDWDKLSDAIATGAVDAAFQACSWGAFQVMGEWWDELDYPSPYAMARGCVVSEAAHLEMLLRYIEHFSLQDELRRVSSNPARCAPFAAAYNGPAFAQNGYHLKIAAAMAAGA